MLHNTILHFTFFLSPNSSFLSLSTSTSLLPFPSLPLSLFLALLPSSFSPFFAQFSLSLLPHSLPRSLTLFLSTSTFFCSLLPLSPSFPSLVHFLFPPSLSYHQVPWMPLPEGSAPLGCPPGLEYLTQIDQILVHQQIEIFECKNCVCVLLGYEHNIQVHATLFVQPSPCDNIHCIMSVIPHFHCHDNKLASFPGPAQLSVTCSTEIWFARRESMGTRLTTRLVGCCLATQILNLKNTKWNGWR